MKILQTPISDNHKSAMFFNGVVAEDKGYKLATYQDGEIEFMGNEHIGIEIIDLGKKGLINDNDVDNEETIDIFVDKFICIYNGDVCDENLIDDGQLYFDNYDEAIEGFEEFLSEL
jgi:hypothetical protein